MNFIIEDDTHEIIFSDIFKNLKTQRMLKTGSRLFGDAGDESDYDIVILHAEELESENYTALEKMGFKLNSADYPDGMGCTFWRHETYKSECCDVELNVNIITTTKAEVYFAWLACGKASVALNLTKEQRKKLFNTIIDEGLTELFAYKCVVSQKNEQG